MHLILPKFLFGKPSIFTNVRTLLTWRRFEPIRWALVAILLFFVINFIYFAIITLTAKGASFNDAADGDWKLGTTWGGACSSDCTEGTDYPGINDAVTIDSHDVTMSQDQSAGSVNITGGNLAPGSNTITVNGDFTVSDVSNLFTKGSSTVNITGSGNINNRNFFNKFANLTIAAASKTTTLTEDVRVDNLTLGTGTITTTSSSHTFQVSSSNGTKAITNSGATFSDSAGAAPKVTISVNLDNASITMDGGSYGSIDLNLRAGSTLTLLSDLTSSRMDFVGQNAHTFDANDFDITISSRFNLGWKAGSPTFNAGSGTIDVDDVYIETTTGTPTLNLESSNFNCADDWVVESGGVVNPGTSTVTMDKTSGTAEITTVSQPFNNLILNDAGGTATYQLLDDLDVNGNLTITGGTLDANSKDITVAGDWTNNDTFTHSSRTVTLDGTSQSVFGSTTFYNLTKATTTADTLTLASSTTQTITNTLTLNGADSQLLSLRSDVAGTQWKIDPQSTRTISYLDVKDSNNTNATAIPTATFNITDSGNNTNWTFNQAPATPSNLLQYTSANAVVDNIATSTTVNIKLQASVTDADATEVPTIFYEVQQNGTSFTSSTTPAIASSCASGTAFAACDSKQWYVTASSGDYSSTPFFATTTIATLTNGSSYNWQTAACDDSDACSSWQTFNAITPNINIDTSAPTISAVNTTITNSKGTITWTTNEASSSIIDIGLVAGTYGSSTPEFNTSTRVLNHSVIIQPLYACRTYHFRVRSKDSANNQSASSDSIFTTQGCSGSAEVRQNYRKQITRASGGTAELQEGDADVTLRIPANFGSADTNFQMKQIDKTSVFSSFAAPTSKQSIGNHVYDFSALTGVDTEVTSFDEPITITLTYTDAEIAGLDETLLNIQRHDGSDWNELSSCSVNIVANTITCTTTQFSTFALFGTTSSTSGSGVPPSSYAPPSQVSVAPIGDEIDTKKETILVPGIVQIESAVYAKTTTNRKIKLHLTGGSNVTIMSISNNKNFTDAIQEPYSQTKEWDLCSTSGGAITKDTCADGLYTVYVKFFTEYGQASESVYESILLAANPNLNLNIKNISETDTSLNDKQSTKIIEKLVETKQEQIVQGPVVPIQTSVTNIPNPVFTKYLILGSIGEEVRKLQEFLSKLPDIYPQSLSTGYFGTLTQKAVQKFQLKYGVIQSPIPGYGHVGPKTRSKLNELINKTTNE